MVTICIGGKSWKMPIYPIPLCWGYCAPQKSDTALVGLIRVESPYHTKIGRQAKGI